MSMMVSSAQTAANIFGLTAATAISKLSLIAITALAMSAISSLPKAAAFDFVNAKYHLCREACHLKLCTQDCWGSAQMGFQTFLPCISDCSFTPPAFFQLRCAWDCW